MAASLLPKHHLPIKCTSQMIRMAFGDTQMKDRTQSDSNPARWTWTVGKPPISYHVLQRHANAQAFIALTQARVDGTASNLPIPLAAPRSFVSTSRGTELSAYIQMKLLSGSRRMLDTAARGCALRTKAKVSFVWNSLAEEEQLLLFCTQMWMCLHPLILILLVLCTWFDSGFDSQRTADDV